jgi:hypothetical protein
LQETESPATCILRVLAKHKTDLWSMVVPLGQRLLDFLHDGSWCSAENMALALHITKQEANRALYGMLAAELVLMWSQNNKVLWRKNTGD